MKYYPEIICCCVLVALLFAISVVYGGFKILHGYLFYFGTVLGGEGWTHATVPISLFIVVGIVSGLVPILLCFLLFTKNNRVLILCTALMGFVVLIEFIAWISLGTYNLNGSLSNVMANYMGKYYNHIELEPRYNIAVQFWDNFQTNLKCCGIHGPYDWVNSSEAPSVGFIPNSCCLNYTESTDSCTKAITKQNVKDVDFTSELIYTKGCINNFDCYYSIEELGRWEIALSVVQLFVVLLARNYLKLEHTGYQALDNVNDESNWFAALLSE